MASMHWLREEFEERYTYGFSWTDKLVDEKTPFQHVQIFETPGFGRVLVLDGAVQLFSTTEFVYHESLVHPPLLVCDKPKRVLIIGGGDGGCAREALKHPGVEQVTLCEIDGQLIDWCKQYLPHVGGNCWEDPRLNLVVDDAAKELAQNETCYDVILADLTDPVGPAVTVYQTAFIETLKSRLNPGGVLAMQAESAVMLRQWHAGTCKLLGQCFDHVHIYHQYVQMYGGLWSFALAADWPLADRLKQESIAQRFAERGPAPLAMYTPAVHAAMFEGFAWIPDGF